MIDRIKFISEVTSGSIRIHGLLGAIYIKLRDNMELPKEDPNSISFEESQEFIAAFLEIEGIDLNDQDPTYL